MKYKSEKYSVSTNPRNTLNEMKTEKIKIQESWKQGKTMNENENDCSNPAAQNSLCFFFPLHCSNKGSPVK